MIIAKRALPRRAVLRGLGSVANGSDAIGGTINVLTEAPRIGGDGHPIAQVQLRGASADRSGIASGRLAVTGFTPRRACAGVRRRTQRLLGSDPTLC